MSALDRHPYDIGYAAGQHDVMTLLACEGRCNEDDHVTAAIYDEAAQLRYRIWCLAHNLAVAGGLCESWEIGRLRGRLTEDYVSKRNAGLRAWFPGCNRSSP